MHPCAACGSPEAAFARHLCRKCWSDQSVRQRFAKRKRILKSVPPTQCRHCHQLAWLKPRKLCYTCYETQWIRDLYPPKFTVRKAGAITPASAPTSARPGSEEKIRVMTERYARNEAIFHPQDAKE